MNKIISTTNPRKQHFRKLEDIIVNQGVNFLYLLHALYCMGDTARFTKLCCNATIVSSTMNDALRGYLKAINADEDFEHPDRILEDCLCNKLVMLLLGLGMAAKKDRKEYLEIFVEHAQEYGDIVNQCLVEYRRYIEKGE